jgi:hypothetical protein
MPMEQMHSIISSHSGQRVAWVWIRHPDSPIKGAGRQPFVVLAEVRKALSLPPATVSDAMRKLAPRFHHEVSCRGRCAS